ncbi:hypothetical protein Y032_0010g860 [Ancylostoma ceylanicum]|uniref:Uncharacterized protein n=2 Tax=Ancylostoma ceylanicum TaxID=53326 RepID=A0A016VG76_9BILA|nr:hypothetical protein Y032_0010g860 [Ancylostoma ceylanicum]
MCTGSKVIFMTNMGANSRANLQESLVSDSLAAPPLIRRLQQGDALSMRIFESLYDSKLKHTRTNWMIVNSWNCYEMLIAPALGILKNLSKQLQIFWPTKTNVVDRIVNDFG